ncbi:MAG: 3-oxoacyl-[acyl-carrier-protein] reductase [Elusimicrobiota bacterium]|nr:3-oxoacyl-[acyl-carrier-protein] reductase [Elusimicrobiota bacterium]
MCEKKLLNKVAIVTGAAQGIGKSIVKKLSSEGANCVIVDVDIVAAEQTAKEINSEYGTETMIFRVDVVNFEEVQNCVDEVFKKFGKIDILVNNAGITKDNLVLRMSEEEWDKVIDVNLKGSFNFIKAVAKYMLKQRSGRIINIASVVGLMGNAGQANYSASKGGLIALTKTLAREFASRNILVNAVAPGFIKTRMTDALSEDQKKKLMELVPLSRLGEPEDVANVVWFLCIEESSYITGQVISVNGGMYM